jgi:phage terminase large subunit GpA-like protein
MVPMARAVHGGAYKRVVMVCSAQAGKTENLIDVIGARLDQRPAPILYVGPIRDFLTDQFEPRLMSLLDEAETLAAKVVRGKRMKKTLKIVAGVPVRLAHAGSSAALKSSPAALALVDEYDEMLANVKGQGDPLGLVEARGETYADFVTAITSTPSRGLVETELDEKSGLRF